MSDVQYYRVKGVSDVQYYIVKCSEILSLPIKAHVTEHFTVVV